MIISLGDAALDVFVRPQGDLLSGSDVSGTVRLLPGGSAANVAVWAARLGAHAAFIGAVGDDPAGAVLQADLTREGVRTHLIALHAPTCAVAVWVDPQGERAMVPDRGAAALLAAAMLRAAWFHPGCRLHVPAYGLFAEPNAGAALQAIAFCRASAGQISIDTASLGPLRSFGRDRFLALLAQIAPDVLFANAEEGAFLTGHADAVQGIALLHRYAPLVLWKLGAEGALALGDSLVRVAGLPVPVVDTTGAGDAFAAAFLVSLERHVSVPEALAAANALAARVVQEIGARPIVPD